VPEPGQPRRHDQIIVPILPVAITRRDSAKKLACTV
jgi:hypothetical protein